ncbi:hypothetical protein RNAN_2344 [Rheinheimera nanhaiensis E407-8]|uniref:Uncharacterized protein n=1 Tax=Rheinheimera nanhaiensis E407-8 TaxID=562729 RepID=I1DZ64_9GAMM|nr:hypothetical protein RNAN_2344 [Rheinheimera nanhaiensis E407-8]
MLKKSGQGVKQDGQKTRPKPGLTGAGLISRQSFCLRNPS